MPQTKTRAEEKDRYPMRVDAKHQPQEEGTEKDRLEKTGGRGRDRCTFAWRMPFNDAEGKMKKTAMVSLANVIVFYGPIRDRSVHYNGQPY